MSNLLKRFLASVGRLFSAFFNIHIKLKYVIILCVLLGGGIYYYTYSTMLKDVGGKDDYAEAMRYIRIKDIVEEKFVDEADRKSMGDSAAAAMISGLGDKWSSYMSAEEYKTYQLYSTNDYSDIGMSILKDETSGGFQVISVEQSSPAAVAGVGAGMLITAVDGEKVAAYTVDDFRTLIRSKMNAKFVLEISGGQYSLEVDCTSVSNSAVTYRLEKTGAGYVQISDFEAGSGQDAIDAIEDLLGQGAVSMVIDLRGNSGGLTSELTSLLDYLLPKGRLFSEVDKNGDETVTESDGMCVQLPMCVLVNSQTFKEAELCAAVLQEYGWASVLGEATTGNTRTQETIALDDGSALRLSTKSYLTPNGVDIAKKGGVVPDMIVYNSDESTAGTTEGTTGGEDGTASTSNDEQLMSALRVLS